MDRNQFTAQAPGTLIRIETPEADWAFIPEPLPTRFETPSELFPLLLRAREEIARLDGVGRYMTNPGVLLRPLQRREALKSSSLEGTFATAEELLLYQLDPRDPASATDPANAWLEVLNYDRALRRGLTLLDEIPFSRRLICEMHQTLLGGVRGANKLPGALRDTQVHIGSDRRFVPPPPKQAEAEFNTLETHMNSDTEIDPLLRAFMTHYQFETIHPFRDGNGRVGRLLLSLTIHRWCGLSRPWLYLSPFFERYKEEYIQRLFRVSTHGDWNGWLAFCMRATVAQAEDATYRFDRLLELQKSFKDRLAKFGKNSRLIIEADGLIESPVVTIPWLMKKHDITFPTAKADIGKLVKAGILEETSGYSRPAKFISREVLAVINDEPTFVRDGQIPLSI